MILILHEKMVLNGSKKTGKSLYDARIRDATIARQ